MDEGRTLSVTIRFTILNMRVCACILFSCSYGLQLVSASCPTGCSFCPNGDESIGLTCSLMEDAHSRTEEVTCEGGEDW